ncbi:BQ2448_5657 [Microbotryum intermedium]|uniref:BQ2448_5657 protein n=1 Tax=Microbotryum intermedium TaxID=269621 RepID=A0A238F4T3_9BASI|nr:BQ2448_5657 [Microbotryum intermedium]
MHRPAQLPLSATVSPFAHRLHRRLVVHAHEDALILQPIAPSPTTKSIVVDAGDTSSNAGVRIPWAKRAQPVAANDLDKGSEDDGIVVEGVAGIVRGFQGSHIILIVSSAVSATLWDEKRSKIHSVDQLVSIPLSDYQAANTALTRHAVKQLAHKARRAAVTSSKATTSASTSDNGVGTSSEGEDGDDDDGETDDGGETTDVDADARPDTPIKQPKKSPFWERLTPKRMPKISLSAIKPKSATPAASGAGAANLTTDSEVHISAVPTPEEAESAANSPDPNQADELLQDNDIVELAEASTSAVPDKDNAETVRSQTELDAKIVAETMRTLRGMAFSYDIDITRSHQRKYEASLAAVGLPSPSHGKSGPSGTTGLVVEPSLHLPLWRRADRRFFWNANIMSSFIDAGLHAFVMVLQQGFVAHSSASVPLQPYTTLASPSNPEAPTHVKLDMVLISRRSIERPGLRYQRRGVNPLGQVANAVETEFLVGAVRDSKQHVASFVQTRGSIPVYWSQSPWALKPAPVLDRTEEERNAALAKHFEKQNSLYGKVVVVNLAEATGKEGVVVEAFRKGVELTQAEDKVKYVYFDFHHETKGMKYENIGKLITQIQPDLEDMQCFWTTDQGANQVFSTQQGVVRTNCIDCLDRTNVVQSAIARFVLNRHLVHLGIAQEDLATHDGLDTAFNTMFADNGDAISREYAGTSALKGDFVRTGRRNWLGAVNDASNSVARLLQSTVTDFFRQATLDFVLGVNPNAFQEFSERLDTSDPGQLLRLAKIREEAIETSTKYCLSLGEERLGGWSMLSPVEPNTLRSSAGKYEEKIVLITSKPATKGALYIVSYEFTLQKVTSFLRIALEDISSIRTGVSTTLEAYILSALDATTRDPQENYGLVVHYPEASAVERVRTYTLKSLRLNARNSSSHSFSSVKTDDADTSLTSPVPPSPLSPFSPKEPASPSKNVFIALKALRRDVIKTDDGFASSRIFESSRDDGRGATTAKSIVDDIVSILREESGRGKEEGWIEEIDIVSLSEAKSHTTIAERLSRGVQRLIWY